MSKPTRRLLNVAFLLFVICNTSSAFEWEAKWIGAPWEGEDFIKEDTLPAPEMKKEIIIGKAVRKATLNVSGLGFFEFYINGVKVGKDVLSPNETSYSHRDSLCKGSIPMDDTNWRNFRVFYLSHDVKDLLRKGSNCLSALLGNGFYSTGRLRWVAPYGTPRLICQMEIEYKDGTNETIVSDDSWQARKSAIVLNDMFEGEIFDARLEGKGEWTRAALRKAPDGKLVLQDGPADRVNATLRPRSIKRLEDGSWQVDFGDYITGWPRLRNFKAPEGTEIELFFPVEPKIKNGCYKYISDGSFVKSYAPKFSWWTFDKVIVKGWPGKLRKRNIIAEDVYSCVRENSRFACSNPLLERINEIWKRTLKDNMHLGVATDCPHREKGPYTGDGQVSCVTAMHNFDMQSFYRKWLHDMSDCQDTLSGYVPNGAPWHPGCGGGVAWGAAMNIIPWEYYLRYGNIEILRENYLPMKEQVRYMLAWRLKDGTMLQQRVNTKGDSVYWMNLGEWCPPYGLAGENLVHTWYLWRCASFTAKAAMALGNEDEAHYYSSLAEEVKAAFHAKFYDSEMGTYCNGCGTLLSSGYGTGNGSGGKGDGSNIFALAMGVPQDRYDRVITAVKSELDANDGHLNTGIFGTSLFFEVLCSNGMAEEAYTAMTKTDFPSYGWWVGQGAMTSWEQWNGNDSHNHPMMGGGLSWMYRWICGMQTDETEPGYRHIIFRPTPAGDLKYASYSTETSLGKASISWKINSRGRFKAVVKVPEGAHATFYKPWSGDAVEIGPGRSVICSYRCNENV